MRLRTWLIAGGLTGLAAGLFADIVLQMPTLYMRLMQTAMVVFGALVAAFVYEGARVVTGGREPNHSTDRPRRRWVVLRPNRRPRGHSGPVA